MREPTRLLLHIKDSWFSSISDLFFAYDVATPSYKLVVLVFHHEINYSGHKQIVAFYM